MKILIYDQITAGRIVFRDQAVLRRNIDIVFESENEKIDFELLEGHVENVCIACIIRCVATSDVVGADRLSDS